MSETATQTPAAPAPGSDQGTPAAAEPVVPEGYVPAAEVEKAREESRRRYQGELDQTKAELTRLQAAPVAPAGGAAAENGGGFDPDAFKASLLRDVYGASQMSQASQAVRAEFPHADPTLFTPEKLSTFASPDALRFAAEDSHKRVAGILDAEKAAIEAKVREEFAAKYGQPGGSAVTPAAPGGDPTPQQLAAMSIAELNALEAANPGVTERVMRAATAGA